MLLILGVLMFDAFIIFSVVYGFVTLGVFLIWCSAHSGKTEVHCYDSVCFGARLDSLVFGATLFLLIGAVGQLGFSVSLFGTGQNNIAWSIVYFVPLAIALVWTVMKDFRHAGSLGAVWAQWKTPLGGGAITFAVALFLWMFSLLSTGPEWLMNDRVVDSEPAVWWVFFLTLSGFCGLLAFAALLWSIVKAVWSAILYVGSRKYDLI